MFTQHQRLKSARRKDCLFSLTKEQNHEGSTWRIFICSCSRAVSLTATEERSVCRLWVTPVAAVPCLKSAYRSPPWTGDWSTSFCHISTACVQTGHGELLHFPFYNLYIYGFSVLNELKVNVRPACERTEAFWDAARSLNDACCVL
jgi:hypothetical protein